MVATVVVMVTHIRILDTEADVAPELSCCARASRAVLVLVLAVKTVAHAVTHVTLLDAGIDTSGQTRVTGEHARRTRAVVCNTQTHVTS